jgi:hypothetical protein
MIASIHILRHETLLEYWARRSALGATGIVKIDKETVILKNSLELIDQLLCVQGTISPANQRHKSYKDKCDNSETMPDKRRYAQ